MYQVSGGRLGSILPGQLPVLLLTTTGHRSGLLRTHPLGYLTQENRYVVVASNAGEPRHPAWYHNLSAHPEAVIQAGTRRMIVRAREAAGEEREALWAEIVGHDPSYAVYQDRTSRLIPLMILEVQPQDG
ncbi:MAG: nitroreductase family deazaflavin-dependent oxidoreductase [Thermoplasmata archaeon]